MNSKIYVFGNFNGRYSQYPDDYTKKIFSTFYNGIQVDRQIITHRHGNLVYYGYICKLDSSHGKDYIGFCIVVNDIMFIRLDKLFSLFEDLIADLITNKYIIERNTKGKLVTNLNVPLGQKDDKILPYINNFIDSYLQQFNNSDYVKLPPVSYDISKEEKQYLTLDSRYDKNREEVVTAVSKYDYTWITTRRDEAAFERKTTQIEQEKERRRERRKERRKEAAFKSKTTQIEQERWKKKERRKEIIWDIIGVIIRVIWGIICLIIIGGIIWGIVFGVNSCRSCSRDKTETPAETATETPMEETMTMTAVETPAETPAETAKEQPVEYDNNKPKIVSFPNVRTKYDNQTYIKKIIITDKYTIVIMTNNNNHGNGYYAWYNIDENAYIKANGQKYFLEKVKGIAIAPDVTYFNTTNEYRTFTLYFPAIPKTTQEIDLIENSQSSWQFYGIEL